MTSFLEKKKKKKKESHFIPHSIKTSPLPIFIPNKQNPRHNLALCQTTTATNQFPLTPFTNTTDKFNLHKSIGATLPPPMARVSFFSFFLFSPPGFTGKRAAENGSRAINLEARVITRLLPSCVRVSPDTTESSARNPDKSLFASAGSGA